MIGDKNRKIKLFSVKVSMNYGFLMGVYVLPSKNPLKGS